MITETETLNETVAQIVVALINQKLITVKAPDYNNQEEVTSAIKRIKAALNS